MRQIVQAANPDDHVFEVTAESDKGYLAGSSPAALCRPSYPKCAGEGTQEEAG